MFVKKGRMKMGSFIKELHDLFGHRLCECCAKAPRKQPFEAVRSLLAHHREHLRVDLFREVRPDVSHQV